MAHRPDWRSRWPVRRDLASQRIVDSGEPHDGGGFNQGVPSFQRRNTMTSLLPHRVRQPRRRTSLPLRPWLRPSCERLEDRLAPTVTTFQQGFGGYTGTLDTNLWGS